MPRLLIRMYAPVVVASWYCWAVEPLQAYCWTAVPLVVPAARASTHFPLPLLTIECQSAGVLGGVVGGVVGVPCPPSQSRPLISHWFCWALANVDEVRVLVS